MRVSVIMPVYNVAQYIAETLRSLQQQTMADYEVLLVDDHGQDDSIEVARRLVGEDARFRFVQTRKNAGPGVARNVGIEAAQGEYIAFIDADDLWQPSFLEQLLNAADFALSDLAFCQLQYRGGSHDGQQHRNPVLPDGEFSPRMKQFFLRHFVTFSVCFLFRREFLQQHSLRFPGLRNSEDTHFLTRCLLLAQSIACVDAPLYIYCIREESLTTGRNPKRWRSRLSALNTLLSDYRQLCADPQYASLQLSQYRGTMYWLWFKKGFAQAIREILHR